MIDPISLGLETFNVVGDEVKVLCPFHDDHKPSASFNIRKGKFYCYSCGTGMNARRVAEELGGTVEQLKDVSILERVKEEKEWRPLLYAPRAIDHPYLQQRGVTNDQVNAFDIKNLGTGIGFPLKDRRGNICGIQERRINRRGASSSRYILHGDKAALWPSISGILDNDRPLLVEGIFGVLRLGLLNIRAFATLSSNIPSRSLLQLNGRRPKIWFDSDYAGCVGAAKIILATGGSALIGSPTPPDDIEPSQEAYDRLKQVARWTSIIDDLAEASKDIGRFWHHISIWRRKYQSNTYDRR